MRTITVILALLLPIISSAQDSSKFFSNTRVSYTMAKGDVLYLHDRQEALTLSYSYNYKLSNSFSIGAGVGVSSMLGPVMCTKSEWPYSFVDFSTPSFNRYDVYPFVSLMYSIGKGAVSPMFDINAGYNILGSTIHMDLGGGCKFNNFNFAPVYALISAQMMEVPLCQGSGINPPRPDGFGGHINPKPVEYKLEGYDFLLGVSISVGMFF